MKMTFRFEGGQELAAALQSRSDRVSRKIVRDVLTDVAEPMRAQWARSAPRSNDPGPHMADNIGISPTRDTDTVGVAIGPTGEFGVRAFMQEFGTIHHPPQPSGRPTFDAGAPTALVEIAKRMWVELAARGVMRSGSSSGPVSGGPGGGTL